MTTQAEAIDSLLTDVRVMPVVLIDRVEDAVPLANALIAGGICAIEITLRTEAALGAIEAVAKDVPDMILGVGTVTTPADLDRSANAGAVFAVSPGLTPALTEAAAAKVETLPLLPGTATASEVMTAMAAGFSRLKCFPAEAVGGRGLLKSLSSPLSGAKFCPTGGLTPAIAPDYLGMPNVFCIGGSWLTPKDAIADGDWARITAIAKEAAAL